MAAGDTTPLAGAEIHGFQTAADLDIDKLMEEASTRWFRPNEVHAMLSNYTCFKIQPQPIDNPTGGTVLLFDRKMLRNFRKDGHNWKKKKDGKTIQEAHEKLKIGNEEKIHVYYARSEDDPNFYRRCYWLLDKNLERIVLVHYRQTSEDNALHYLPAPVDCTEALPSTNKMHNGSPITLRSSTSGSATSEVSGSAATSEEINSGDNYAIYTGSGLPLVGNSTELRNHELSLHDINTLDWDDLVESPKNIDATMCREGDTSLSDQPIKNELRYSMSNANFPPPQGLAEGVSGRSTDFITSNDFSGFNETNNGYFQAVKDQERPSTVFSTVNPNSQMTEFKLNALSSISTPDIFLDDVFLNQNSFGQWNAMNDDSLGLLDELQLEAPISIGQKLGASMVTVQSSTQEQLLNITDVSPGWAYCTEETKVLVVGYFYESHKHLAATNIYCVFGGACVRAEAVQAGVYRCKALPHTPGVVDLYLTLDGDTPISQVLSFDYRTMPGLRLNGEVTSAEDENKELKWEEFHVQTRLAHLLFSTTKSISLLSSGVPAKSLKEAKKFEFLTYPLVDKDWMHLLKQGSDSAVSSQDLFELVLRNKLQEWLLEKVAEGCKTTTLDSQGQGVIHLCAILDYAWAVRLFLLSGMSLDFRDACGRTALHWAAYCGREKMVATLLTAGANPSLVTDPTSENPGGCTAADLASKQGYEGLAAYLAEKGLTAHFQAMSLSGHITAPVPPSTKEMNSEIVYAENLSEQELCLKESLAAYRNAADAADRIQAAFRERALKQQTKAVQLAKPEMEAEAIVAALKIQHAFRNYNRRKVMKAAARIQSHFRTWKTRRTFLEMRKRAIKIQAAFRGHQVRKQYRKIVWSVGVLEKAILRWRWKRKGLRGIHVQHEAMRVDLEQEITTEEEFYRVSREQAEERVLRSVTRVQAMFRSYRAQQEYRRMKETHEKAKLEFSELNQQQEATI